MYPVLLELEFVTDITHISQQCKNDFHRAMLIYQVFMIFVIFIDVQLSVILNVQQLRQATSVHQDSPAG